MPLNSRGKSKKKVKIIVVFGLQGSHVNTEVVSVVASLSNMYMLKYGHIVGSGKVVHDVLVPYEHCLPWHKEPPSL